MADRLYGRAWQAARKAFLTAHPLCVYCERMGKVVAASVVDHVTPHKGDLALFWDRGNWQALCKPCHDSIKQREERGQGVAGCDMHGNPIDSSHTWARG